MKTISVVALFLAKSYEISTKYEPLKAGVLYCISGHSEKQESINIASAAASFFNLILQHFQNKMNNKKQDFCLVLLFFSKLGKG